MSARVVLGVVLLATAAVGAMQPALGQSASPNVSIVGVLPNPATEGDRGEYVLVNVSGPADVGDLVLADGEDVVRLPDRTVDGAVAITDDPVVAGPLAGETVVRVPEMLALSNAGETVEIRRDDRVLDVAQYEDAPEAEVYRNGRWTHLGATDFDVANREEVPVRAFALPDAPGVTFETLRGADDRILLAGYTLTSPRVVDALRTAERRGVDVSVLVEGGPVGGVASRQKRALDVLAADGVRVVVSGGRRARYDFHHAKYAVVDRRALVTSENWKPSGVGGHASRGWGVLIRNADLADHLARVFAADADGLDARPWRSVEPEGYPADVATATFPARFPARRFTADDVRVIAAPDNAEPALRTLLGGAEESIRIEQVSVDPTGPLYRSTIAAARRGVAVRVLLSGAWYVEADNRAVVEALRRLARRESLPLEAKIVEPRSRYDHVHVKGVIVDGRRTVVGSVNWNPHSLRENREVAVVIDDPAVGRYYGRLFRADWRGASWRVHWITLGVLVVATVGSLWWGSRIDFRDDGGEVVLDWTA
ncbi:MAG: phosphatidylserine/phosphatidylglycerophosphate/cardiolipin synthase family protein [Halanaeroarchaeum sp.]